MAINYGDHNISTSENIIASGGNFLSLSINGNNLGLNSTMNGRLSLSSSEAVTTNDITNANTLYYHPYDGNTVSLYDITSSSWKFYTLSSTISKSLSTLVTANSNYDVFLFLNSGVLDLQFILWNNSGAGTSVRNWPLVRQDGVLVGSFSSGQNFRYIGTIRTSGSGVCEDNLLKRFLYNHYNKIKRRLTAIDATDFTFVGDGVWQPYNSSTANRFEFVDGLAYEPIVAHLYSVHYLSSGTGNVLSGLGLNSTNSILSGLVNSDKSVGADDRNSSSNLVTVPLGYNFIQMLQKTVIGATAQYLSVLANTSIDC